MRRRRQQRRDERALPPSLPKQVDVAAELQGQLARGSNLLHVVGDEEQRVGAALLLQVGDAAGGENGELLAVVPAQQ